MPRKSRWLPLDGDMSRHPQAVEFFEEATGDIALGEIDSAITKYRECVRLDPEYFDAWHALGMALMNAARFEEAIEAGRKAVEIDPNDQLAWSSLSIFYVKNGQVPEAEAAGAKARILSWGGKLRKDSTET
jgi:Flp pilus assembly protein TadD